MPVEDAAYGAWLLSQKLPAYDLFRRYDRGLHGWMFASETLRDLFDQLMRSYRLNVCRPVTRQVARRLNIDTWDGDKAAAQWWDAEGQKLQNRHVKETIREGDASILVWPQDTVDGPLRAHRLRADEAITVYREDDPDSAEFAVKVWTVTVGGRQPEHRGERLVRVNVYYPDRVERFVTSAPTSDGEKLDLARLDTANLREFDPDDEDGGPVIGYTGTLQAAGADGILPLVHFPAQPDDTPYGTSVLADVTPVQDEINHIARTTLAALEPFALPFRVFTAVEMDNQSHTVTVDGEEKTVESGGIDYHPLKDWFMALPGENSNAIQLPEANIEQLLEVRRAAIQNATLASGVPLGLLAEDSGSIPSGVALRVVESPLTDLVRDLQQDATVPWTNVARLQGWEAAPSWSSPITMDDTEKAEYAGQLIELGIPAAKAVEDAGIMSADDFREALAEFRDLEEDAGRALMNALRNGADPAGLAR